jgi:isocitrate dehydrogenase
MSVSTTPIKNIPITVAHGNGIGPEIMEATLLILKEAGAKLDIDTIEIGEAVYKRGISTGIEDSAWDSLRRTKVFLKAPITTPQGGGFKSLNVTIRKTLGLFANVRPCVSYHPFVKTNHPGMDVVIVRENEEDVYAGIEYKVTQCLKLISAPGCQKIMRFAFEYAKQNGRKKVTCFSKDNIMKMTDGLFHKTYDDVAKEYPDIQAEHYIVDIGMARLANTPERFDVIVTENLYGDILSDIAAEIAGSVGLAGTANIGENIAMFEAIHGSAPDIAGQNIGNPSGLMLSAVMMLVHIGQAEIGTRIHNAWLSCLEEGLHTKDIYTAGKSTSLLGTKEFARAVIERLGRHPTSMKPVKYNTLTQGSSADYYRPASKATQKKLVGLDLYLADWEKRTDLIASVCESAGKKLGIPLTFVSNRGVKVWPEGAAETFCTDLYRCRFIMPNGAEISYEQIQALQKEVLAGGLTYSKLELLQDFDGVAGYSAGAGE